MGINETDRSITPYYGIKGGAEIQMYPYGNKRDLIKTKMPWCASQLI